MSFNNSKCTGDAVADGQTAHNKRYRWKDGKSTSPCSTSSFCRWGVGLEGEKKDWKVLEGSQLSICRNKKSDRFPAEEATTTSASVCVLGSETNLCYGVQGRVKEKLRATTWLTRLLPLVKLLIKSSWMINGFIEAKKERKKERTERTET